MENIATASDARWLTPTKAARELGVARSTIYSWMKRGSVRVERLPSGRPVILVSTLLRPDTVYPTYKPI